MWGLSSHSCAYKNIFEELFLKYVFAPLPLPSVLILCLYSWYPHIPGVNTEHYFGGIKFGANTCGTCIHTQANAGNTGLANYLCIGFLPGGTVCRTIRVIFFSLQESLSPDPTPTPPNTPKRTRNGAEMDPKRSQTEPKRSQTEPKWTEIKLFAVGRAGGLSG